MTDHDDVEQRAYYHADPDRISLRVDEDSDDGLFRIRMPISSTLEARDGKAFEKSRLDGWARQIDEGHVPVYGDHGTNVEISGSRYSAFGKLGYYDDPDVRSIDGMDGEHELVVDTVMMDPDTLPEETGALRENMARLKAQAERGIPITQSVGWSDDVGDRDVPGGSDLLEGSIVGVPSDSHAMSENSTQTAALARAAVDAGADPDAFVEAVRDVVDTDTPASIRHLSDQQAEIAEGILDAYRDEQGNGSVENFEDWMWSVAYYNYDDSEFHAARTALQEFFRETTPLDEPVDERFGPFLGNRSGGSDDGDGDDADDESRDREDTVTDDTDSSGDESGNDNRDDSDDIDAGEYRETMLEMQRSQTEALTSLAESLREDGDDDEDDEDDDDDDEDEDRTVTIDGEEMSAREAVDELRDGLTDAEPETPDADRDGGAGDDDSTDDETNTETRDADPRDLLK